MMFKNYKTCNNKCDDGFEFGSALCGQCIDFKYNNSYLKKPFFNFKSIISNYWWLFVVLLGISPCIAMLYLSIKHYPIVAEENYNIPYKHYETEITNYDNDFSWKTKMLNKIPELREFYKDDPEALRKLQELENDLLKY